MHIYLMGMRTLEGLIRFWRAANDNRETTPIRFPGRCSAAREADRGIALHGPPDFGPNARLSYFLAYILDVLFASLT